LTAAEPKSALQLSVWDKPLSLSCVHGAGMPLRTSFGSAGSAGFVRVQRSAAQRNATLTGFDQFS